MQFAIRWKVHVKNPKFYWCLIDINVILSGQGFIKWIVKLWNEIFTAM